MEASQIAKAIQPDVLTLLATRVQEAGMELNAFLRSVLSRIEESNALSPVEEYVTTPTGIIVDVTGMSCADAEAASLSLRECARRVTDPEDLTRIGREEWAREHA